ncbi:RIKEN cDNA 2610021K21, isoform CRA_c [Mus musculus]|nr:RIKEN cDNA 2610021K21, isoform CRA_c [Mus musculus]
MFLSEAGARPRAGEASASERRKWVKVFKACDEDNKGYLSREDFKVAIVMLFGYKPSKIEADAVMSSVNPNTSESHYTEDRIVIPGKTHSMASETLIQ